VTVGPAAELPATFRDAMVALRSRQKTSKGAPAYSRLVNRRLGRVFAASAYMMRMTPNQVTCVSALFTFGGIATIALVDPTVASSIGVCLMLVIGYALDAADGQLARLRGGGSVSGEWLDHAVDAIKIATIHLAVLVNWYRFDHFSDRRLVVPIVFQIVASVLFFVIILNDQLRRAHRGSTAMILEGEGRSSTLYSLAVVPTDYGLLCIVFVLLAWHQVFFWVYTLLMLANLAFLLLALAKWYREMLKY
jgi:phosphatidylglycerophosphate synthase